ncbi:MAG TPA: protein phosphatase 2C domain-containing protein [Candidatus Krumholzibacteria bacterium]|nr:protein phosphatase 2C domain-containing protein [Candidatus Krumholzibacteria bacterium]
MRIVAKTDVGLVRKRNEDYFIIADSHDLVVLCDGMGGHPGGDLASRMVAEEVQRQITQGNDEKVVVDASADLTRPLAPFVPLLQSVFAADRKLREYGSRHPEYHGMGTTMVVVQEHEGVVFVAHVGDSRVYSFRRGKLTQVTHDHSVVATHPEYAHLAGMRNILTRAMGVGEELEVDFVIAPAEADELYMLCTDGLHNYVQENRIVEILGNETSPEERVDTLIEEAKKGGGGDNITLSLAWGARPSKPKQTSLRGAVVEADGHLKVHVDDEG